MCVCGHPVSHDPRQSEFLVECHYCASWFHGRCVHVNEVDAMEIVKFACPPCTKHGNVTMKYQDSAPMVDMDDLTYAPLPIQRHRLDASFPSFQSHSQNQNQNQTHHGAVAAPAVQYPFSSYYKKNTEPFRRTLRAAVFARSGVRMVASPAFGASYFKFHALDEPLLVLDGNYVIAGLVRALPVIGLQDISALLSTTTSTVRALEIGSQESFTLSSSSWQALLAHPVPDAPITAQFRVLETAFRQQVAPPLAVAEIDWHFVVPRASGARNQDANPECYGTLCGPGAFFDFSLAPDCKATWLAVSNGEIDVFLIEPTGANVEAFNDWKRQGSSASSSSSSSSPSPSSNVFLADRVDRCTKCTVKNGATLVIPSGYIYAIFSDHGGSFYTGYFANTLNLATHLDVWSRLEVTSASGNNTSSSGSGSRGGMAAGADNDDARRWQETSFAHGWSQQHPSPAVAPPPPFNAHVWSLVCHAINECSSNAHVDVLQRVSSLERDALRRALPLLRQWSGSPRSIERLDNVSWLPSTVHDGASLVNQLEQVLLSQSSGASMGDVTASSKIAGLPSLSPNEASYLYSAAGDDDMWNSGAVVSSAFASSGTSYHQDAATASSAASGASSSNGNLWDYSPYHSHSHQHHHSPGAGGGAEGSPTYYHHSQLASSHLGSSSLHATGYANNSVSGPSSATFGGYLDSTSSSPNGSHHHLGMLGAPGLSGLHHQHPHHHHNNNPSSNGAMLVDVTTGFGHDIHLRHRASCHRCGNLRKKNVRCPKCPHIFCQKCGEKMVEEHGESVFADGCPVCKELCCCGKNRTMTCARKFHCYKKCPATKRQTN